MCLYFCHAYFILSHKSEKRVTERNKRLNLWSLFIKKPVLDYPWLNHWKWLCPRSYVWFSKFLSNGECLHCFSWRNVLPKLSNITLAYPKSIKMNELGQFWLVQTQQNAHQFELFKVSKTTSLKIYNVSSHVEVRNIKFE